MIAVAMPSAATRCIRSIADARPFQSVATGLRLATEPRPSGSVSLDLSTKRERQKLFPATERRSVRHKHHEEIDQ